MAGVSKMPRSDGYESELLSAFEKDALKSVATKAELSRFKALEEGMPYQTLIASILHKYVTGQLSEREGKRSPAGPRQKKAPTRRTGEVDV